MITYVGIDPGKSGAIVTLQEVEFEAETNIHIEVHLLNNEPEQTFEFINSIPHSSPIVIERVHAMPIWWGGSGDKKKPETFVPKQGIASTFKFGESYGFIKGLLFPIVPKEVLSRVWQKRMNCLTGGDKKISLRKAQELYPSLKVTHAFADALLIATYCKLYYHQC